MHRLIYAWNYVEWGGAQVYVLGLIKTARREFEVIVILPKGTDPQFLGFLRSNSIRYEEFETAADLRPAVGILAKINRRWRRLQSEDEMIKKIRQVGVRNTIVHTDIGPSQSLFSLIRLCRIAPVFITGHNALPDVSWWRLYRMRIKFFAASFCTNLHVFCANEHAARYFKVLYSRRIADSIMVTSASIDPEKIEGIRKSKFDRAETLAKLGISSDKFIVLSVGQFIDRKGRWTLLDAARKVVSEDDNIEFVWLTSSDPDEFDRSRIATYKLKGRFHLVSSADIGTDHDDVLSFFRIGDVFALPSFVEGLPISLLESMALGLAAISTNAYGIPEAIRNEETGLLIEPGDAGALAAAILRLKNDPYLRRRLAVAGRNHVLHSFDERKAALIAVNEYRHAFDPLNGR